MLSRNPNYGGKEGGGQILNKGKIFNLINGILRKCMVIQDSTMLVRHIKADDVVSNVLKVVNLYLQTANGCGITLLFIQTLQMLPDMMKIKFKLPSNINLIEKGGNHFSTLLIADNVSRDCFIVKYKLVLL